MLTRSTLSVPKPCHENWQTMTPAAQGRRCAACDKVVVDFTRMTDAEILAYLGQSAGKSCGRFRAEQLNRPLARPLSEPATSWRKRMLAMAALLGLGVGAAPVAAAQQLPRPVRVPQTITLGMVATQPAPRPGPVLVPPPVVRGVVLDSTTREPLPGVTVLVVGTTIGVSSNKDGEFELTLPEVFKEDGQIQVSYVGYITQRLPISAFSNKIPAIELAPGMMGEVVVIGGYCKAPLYTPRGLWQRLTQPFRRY